MVLVEIITNPQAFSQRTVKTQSHTIKQKYEIERSTILRRNPDQLFTLVDDEIVMLNIEHEEYLNLNSHASYIWNQLESPISFGKLIENLCDTFDVEENVCVADTLGFLEEFIEIDIIHILDETA